jgi:hypothetical protein
MSGAVLTNRSKRTKDSEHWLDTHRDIFEAVEMTWPPVINGDFGAIAEQWGNRVAESVYFCHARFPPLDNTWQFYDANHSLERLLRWPCEKEQLHCPWRVMVPTLTGSSKIIIRYYDANEAKLTLRPLSCIESMKLIGWDVKYWRRGSPNFSDEITPELLYSLAGNAFSCFAFAPLFASILGALGIYHRPAVADEPVRGGGEEQTAESMSNFSDSE